MALLLFQRSEYDLFESPKNCSSPQVKHLFEDRLTLHQTEDLAAQAKVLPRDRYAEMFCETIIRYNSYRICS